MPPIHRFKLELMELENIVANTVYIKARECGSDINKGRSKKWRRLLQFPHISYCLDLKDKIDCSYGFVVEHQPIGRLLFRSFCETRDQYAKCCAFLDAVESFEVDQAPGGVLVQELLEKCKVRLSRRSGVRSIGCLPALVASCTRGCTVPRERDGKSLAASLLPDSSALLSPSVSLSLHDRRSRYWPRGQT